MATKKKKKSSTGDTRIDDILSELATLKQMVTMLVERNQDLQQMVGQIGHNLDVMRGERTTSAGSKPFNGTTRPEDMPDEHPKRLCPTCFGTMRWVRNSNDGSVFAGCRNFPECRGTRKKEQALSEIGLKFDLEAKARKAAEKKGEDDPEPEANSPWGAVPEDAPF